MSRAQSLTICLGLLLLLAASACQAQLQGSCELREITVQPLSNAVVIRIKADGLLNFTLGDWNLWGTDPVAGWYGLKRVDHLTLNLENARAGNVGMQEIGIYPVGHLAFSVPPGAQQNVGLLCTLTLLQPAYFTYLQIPGAAWDQTNNPHYSAPEIMVLRTQTQNEALIIVTSDRQYQPPPEHYAGEHQALSLTGTADRLSLCATNADLHTLVEALAVRTGTPLVLDDTVQRYVSACLNHLPLERLLQVLAAGYGLAVFPQGRGYYLTSALSDNPAAYYAAEQRSIPLHYLHAVDVPNLLPETLLPYLHPETQTNSVVITAAPAILDKVQRDLAVLDQPAPHCRLRVWLISTQGHEERLRTILAQFAGGNSALAVNPTSGLTLQIAQNQAPTILADLQALATRQEIHMLALPSLEAMNGEQADLFVGQTIYYFQLVGAGVQQMTLNSVQAGSQLYIQPQASGEQITAHLIAENSSLVETNSLGPLLQEYTINSQVRLGAGRCVLIGGLTLAAHDRSTQRLPGWRPLTALFDNAARTGETNEVWALVEGSVQRDALLSNGKTPGTGVMLKNGAASSAGVPPALEKLVR